MINLVCLVVSEVLLSLGTETRALRERLLQVIDIYCNELMQSNLFDNFDDSFARCSFLLCPENKKIELVRITNGQHANNIL